MAIGNQIWQWMVLFPVPPPRSLPPSFCLVPGIRRCGSGRVRPKGVSFNLVDLYWRNILPLILSYPLSVFSVGKYIYVMLGYRYCIGETCRGLVVSGTHIYSGLVRVEFEFSSLGTRDEIEVKPRSLGKTRHQRDSCVFVFFSSVPCHQ